MSLDRDDPEKGARVLTHHPSGAQLFNDDFPGPQTMLLDRQFAVIPSLQNDSYDTNHVTTIEWFFKSQFDQILAVRCKPLLKRRLACHE